MVKKLVPKSFNFKGLKIDTHPDVYDPAEDTFLLLDSLKFKSGKNYFEIGTGCGIISLYASSIGADVICSDINPIAVELVKKNYYQNINIIKGNFDVRLGDLFSVLNYGDFFDIIIFNPPYLPTRLNDLIGGSGWFDKSVDGGVDGLFTIKRFIDQVGNYLKNDGYAYFVFSSLSNREELDEFIDKSSLKKSIVASKLYNDEQLNIYCLNK